jgi:hypothetical protein
MEHMAAPITKLSHTSATLSLRGHFVSHPLSQAASFFGSLAPQFGMIEIWCGGHGTRTFSDHIGTSAPIGAYSRADSKKFVSVRNLKHHLLALFAAHLFSHGSGFFRSPMPISGFGELRCSEHGTHSSRAHTR